MSKQSRQTSKPAQKPAQPIQPAAANEPARTPPAAAPGAPAPTVVSVEVGAAQEAAASAPQGGATAPEAPAEGSQTPPEAGAPQSEPPFTHLRIPVPPELQDPKTGDQVDAYQRYSQHYGRGVDDAIAGDPDEEMVNDAAYEAGYKAVDPATKLRLDGPTLKEYVEAGYKAESYPPKGYAPVAPPPPAVAKSQMDGASDMFSQPLTYKPLFTASNPPGKGIL